VSLSAADRTHRLQVSRRRKRQTVKDWRSLGILNCAVFLRYGVEPPVLVKLEKEIELEETLLMTEEPPPAVKTFSVCCQHGGLYQPGVSPDRQLIQNRKRAQTINLCS